MNKKGYYLMFDAFLGVTIIIVGLMLLFFQYSYQPIKLQTLQIAEDSMNYLENTKINDITNTEINNLILSGYFKPDELKMKIIDYIALKYSEDNITAIKEIIDVTFKNIRQEQHNYEFYIDGVEVTSYKDKNKETSSLIMSAKRTRTIINNEGLKPIIIEVDLWQ